MQAFEGRATVIRRRKVFLLLEALGVIVLVVATLGRLGAWGSLLLLVPATALAFGAAAAFGRDLSPSEHDAAIYADALGVAIDERGGRVAVPTSMLRAAELAPEEPVVAILTSSWRHDFKLRFARRRDARAFVAALETRVIAVLPAFRTTTGGMARLFVALAAAVPLAIAIRLVAGHLGPIAPELASAIVPIWILGMWLVTSADLHVGAKGVSIARFGRRPVFLGYADIVAIVEEHDDLVFERRDGVKLRLGFADTRWLTGDDRRPTTRVLARVNRACSACAARASAPSHERFAAA
jgi:hypothetical protein